MKTFASRLPAPALAAAALFLAPGAFAADLTLQKVPALTVDQTPAYPENLARLQLGAKLDLAEGADSTPSMQAAEAGLLSGDPAASFIVPAGTTTFVVALPRIENVSSVSFLSHGAPGKVAIATASAKLASDSPQWRKTAAQDLSDIGANVKIGPGEAKYVRLTFTLPEATRISGFGIYADPKVSDFTAPRGRKKNVDDGASFGLVSYNYADMQAKARALYVSSGADLRSANKMIDEQNGTAYHFAVEDKSPAAVIDLGRQAEVRRLSAVYPAQAGRMEFYVLAALPGRGSELTETSSVGAPIPAPDNPPATITVSDALLTEMKAVGSVTDDGTQGKASVEIPATKGRYVMLRWIPAAEGQTEFSLAEIAALGPSRKTLLAVESETSAGGTETEQDYQIDGKTMVDGKTMIEPKDMPGEGQEDPPAEGPPPSLPQPPPFTFVPILVPTSG